MMQNSQTELQQNKLFFAGSLLAINNEISYFFFGTETSKHTSKTQMCYTMAVNLKNQKNLKFKKSTEKAEKKLKVFCHIIIMTNFFFWLLSLLSCSCLYSDKFFMFFIFQFSVFFQFSQFFIFFEGKKTNHKLINKIGQKNDYGSIFLVWFFSWLFFRLL